MKDIAIILRALSDPTRRLIFEAVAKAGEIQVRVLADQFAVSQPAISQHLKCLRDAGLVIERRNGREAFYRLVPNGLFSLREWISFVGFAGEAC